MKPVLAILAHHAAQPTLNDFLPKWLALGCRLICYVPQGDTVTGFDEVRNIGESAYSGAKVFRRFLDTLTDVFNLHSLMPNGYAIIAEYDTVPLRPEVPPVVPGSVSSHFVKAHPPEGIAWDQQLCALSPWVMDRWTIGRFIEAGEKHLAEHGDCDHLKGLLDRWIGEVIVTAEIPIHSPPDFLGYPWHPGAHKRIRDMRLNWIHGWKSKAEFGDLWNEY